MILHDKVDNQTKRLNCKLTSVSLVPRHSQVLCDGERDDSKDDPEDLY